MFCIFHFIFQQKQPKRCFSSRFQSTKLLPKVNWAMPFLRTKLMRPTINCLDLIHQGVKRQHSASKNFGDRRLYALVLCIGIFITRTIFYLTSIVSQADAWPWLPPVLFRHSVGQQCCVCSKHCKKLADKFFIPFRVLLDWEYRKSFHRNFSAFLNVCFSSVASGCSISFIF